MAFKGQHVSGFSLDGKLYALVNDQGILKIWDTETNELKQEYTPNLHLSGPCTALRWIVIPSQDRANKKNQPSHASDKSLYIAIGTSTGGVNLYSYSLGKVNRSLKGEGHAGKVTSVFYDNGEKLYTCGDDCRVIVWNLSKEQQVKAWSVGNEKPHSIAYLSGSDKIVVGARQIGVYSVQSQELVQSFTGHTSEIAIMTTFSVENMEYVVTASKMERIVCLWKIGKKAKNQSATCTLLMEDIAYNVTCQLDGDNLKVASVTRSGVIHVYLIPLVNIKAEKPIKPKVTIEIASEGEKVIEPVPAITASLQHTLKNEIIFGYGDKRLLVFETIKPDFSEKHQVLVRADPRKHVTKSTKTEDLYKSELKTIAPFIDDKDVDYQTGATALRKKPKPGEMPFEARLQNLYLNTGEKPQPKSKVQLLVQALHSKDPSMLMSVLLTGDAKVIEMTLQRLPVQYVGSLVNELTLLMQKKRVNVEMSVNWLRILAQTHSSQLMAMGSDDLLEKFGPCIGLIEDRANTLMELSKLSGRLNLLVSQIKRNTEKDCLNIDNVLVYQDNDSSSSDLEGYITEKPVSENEWQLDEDSVEEMEI